MGFTRGNRVRETQALVILPMKATKVGWCANECRRGDDTKKAAAFVILVMGYPFGTYCKECAKIIWDIWNREIGEEADEGRVVKNLNRAAA